MISPRLNAIAQLIEGKNCVADIGTDHGIIPIELIRSQKSEKVIATDISAQSLMKTQKKVKLNHLEERIDMRVGDGLAPINQNECDAIIIAGMGGLLIRDILKDGLSKLGTAQLIVQPMNNAQFVRMMLEKIHYRIVKEIVIYERHHYYQIIFAVPGLMKIDNPIDYWIGLKSASSFTPTYSNFIEWFIKQQEKIIKIAGKQKNTANVSRKINQTKYFIRMLKEQKEKFYTENDC
ncbi:tRNA (adenine(22)-N(1))-methyltransferase [Pseudoramibacter sp.]|jgi:tRNA (adenine22-N1)-methyltransferase|uniref:tRNA (adenine(22)-N(1))-methyltransferase n=1 Tax=Pseudoramibacter sp. TaxID=2034862 RepID=UPI0025EB3583|nr:class I SAM-dependent methyltransferase [Pseudoramibacter sp.]MCH4072828.1 class I SAM-dependent methyltransferase [Pseudoramibacter sp.]MCH4106599.1 class I SAM-dependent methyltransferase [Pseudoramibacter sp.]